MTLPRPLVGSWGADGKFQPDYDATLITSAARTTSSNSDVYEMGDCSELRLTLTVSAASGTTPTLDVVVQTSRDGSTNWQQIGAFGQMTTTGSQEETFDGADRYVKAVWTINGTTPSFTFSLLGRAV